MIQNVNGFKFPDELTALPNWAASTPNKKPVSAITGNSVEWQKNLTDFESAARFAHSRNYNLAFGFTEHDNITGIDIDSCRCPITGKVELWALDILARFDSYSEVSISQTGIKILFKGNLKLDKKQAKYIPPGEPQKHGDHSPHAAFYSGAGNFNLTGRVYNDQPVMDRQDVFEQFARECLGWISESERPAVVAAATLPKPIGNLDFLKDQPSPSGLKPGDDYNQRHNPGEVLESFGWSPVGNGAWRRPGKSGGGHSATLHKNNSDRVLFWSTENSDVGQYGFESADLGENQPTYSAFEIYARMKYSGDFSAAAKDLAAQGYGDQTSRSSAQTTESRRHNLKNSAETGGCVDLSPRKETENDVFPVEVLPDNLKEIITSISDSVNVDPCMVFQSYLSSAAAAIGYSRSICLKSDWYEKPILWTANVADSGAGKTPSQNAILKPVRSMDSDAFDKYRSDLASYEESVREWEKNKKKGSPPVKPRHYRGLVQDTTVEQLASVLQDNPRGVVMVRDELHSLLGGFNKYTSGKGSERSDYLSLWSGESLIQDRKISSSAYVKHPFLSITGGIQPSLLASVFGSEETAAGLPARFLFAVPEKRQRRWSDSTVTESTTDSLNKMYATLYGLQPSVVGLNDLGEEITRPRIVKLSDEAKELFIEFYNHNSELTESQCSPDLVAAWAKFPSQCARISLVLHCSTSEPSSLIVTGETMSQSIQLIEWYRIQTDKVASAKKLDERQETLKRVLKFIDARAGDVTARDLVRSHVAENTTKAEQLLQDLVSNGFGSWKPVSPTSKGGRPTRKFILDINSMRQVDTT